MAYKYETKNCKHCEHCVKTDKGLYCSNRENHSKVTNGGWCIDMKEKVEKMDNNMIPAGTTVHINPEDIKWEVKGDLISREALKNSIKSYADDQYAENEYLGEYAIMDIIDKAPAVEYTFEEAFQKTVCEQRLYCPAKPKGEWKETGYETGALGITYRQTQCSNCGWEHALPMWWNFCPNCGADMRGKKDESENEL